MRCGVVYAGPGAAINGMWKTDPIYSRMASGDVHWQLSSITANGCVTRPLFVSCVELMKEPSNNDHTSTSRPG